MISAIIWLMVIMQFKHFIADYPLQGKYMLGKFLKKGWVAPLAAHCSVHFVFTLVIALAFLWSTAYGLLIALGVASMDFTIHFIMDRIKASPDMLGRYKALSQNEFKGLLQEQSEIRRMSDGVGKDLNTFKFNKSVTDRFKSNVLFWWALGLDQLVHHLTDIAVVAIIVNVI